MTGWRRHRPTVDHYIPPFITLGAAAHPNRPVRTTVEGYTIGFSKLVPDRRVTPTAV
jgi:hypothetical protein